ncbi:hypothetical protein, partial [Enhygromyxa salina]|uniref:hypothetical protein n=1 Tax=Enhygromyxa salina TaxID=215803 RepID=UPI0011BA537A
MAELRVVAWLRIVEQQRQDQNQRGDGEAAHGEGFVVDQIGMVGAAAAVGATGGVGAAGAGADG